MRTTGWRNLILSGATFAGMSTHAAVQLVFDPADSNIGVGRYDFLLTGAPAASTFSDFNSTLVILDWSVRGNTLNPVVGNVSPSAWNVTLNTINVSEWILESYSSPNNAVDGRFEVTASPNLNGTLRWQFNWPGNNTFSTSGNVTISAVPEPNGYGLIASCLLVLIASRPIVGRAKRLA